MSLSIRIFIWFWISLLLIAALTYAWSKTDLNSPISATDEQIAFSQGEVTRFEKRFANREERQFRNQPGGPPRVVGEGDMPPPQERNKQFGLSWAYDHQLEDFLDTRVPREFEQDLVGLLVYSEPVVYRTGPFWIIGPIEYQLESGKHLSLFFGLPPHLSQGLHIKQILHNSPLLLSGLALLLGALSYVVARQITNPLASIRRTAEQIAAGDFKADVSPQLLNRKDEIGSLSRTTSKMGQAINQALVAHKRLLSDVSHELRSPLTRLSLANTLLTKRLGEHSENSRIASEVEVLNGMIEQLLSLSRIQFMPETERVVFDLRPVLKQQVEDACFCFPELTIALVDQTEPSQPALAKGDHELFGRAVQNVLNNASRYCQQQIQISLTVDAEYWLLRIEDDGPGISEDEQEKIFVPFYRPEFARQRDKGGTGLGLAIVEQAVHFHNGTVSAKRASLGGLAIEMKLPRSANTVANS